LFIVEFLHVRWGSRGHARHSQRIYSVEQSAQPFRLNRLDQQQREAGIVGEPPVVAVGVPGDGKEQRPLQSCALAHLPT
jgi:hypothetical protein